MRRLRAFLLSLACVVGAGSALANGRFPSANQLLIDPGDPEHVVLRATYGVLTSHDAGRSFEWVCEDAVGYTGDVDPALVILQDGSVAAGFARDLRVARGDVCEWDSPFAASGAKENFIDVTLDPGDPKQALFLSRRLDSAHLVHLLTLNQADSAPEPLGSALGDDVSPVTLEVAPSQPSRIYVSAIGSDLNSLLLRSDDRGETWERLPIHPDESYPAYIAAVDPNDADRLYLRLDGPSEDVLLVSDDAGESFTEAFTLPADMLGFALSPDGARVALGGPAAGLFVADADGLDFQLSPTVIANLSCLKWTDRALLACANDKADGFTLGSSTDEGQSFEPLFQLKDLKQLACGASTSVGSACPALWPALAQNLSIPTASSSQPQAGGGGCALVGRVEQARAPAILALALVAGLLTARRRKTPRDREANLRARRCTPRRSENVRPTAPNDRR